MLNDTEKLTLEQLDLLIDGRAGRYVKQPTGYKAFIPAPLPPVPAIKVESEMQALLSSADRALGRLDGSIQTLPNPDLFVFMYVRKEAVLSSQIEGTQSSLTDLLKAEANIFDSSRPKDVDEVINYVNAMNYGLTRLKDIPLCVRLIKEIHARLLDHVRGGRLSPGETRTSQNWIGPYGCTLMEATFIPPPAHEAEIALGHLEKFMHLTDNLAPLIRIGLIHAQFETIHPFLDGNGRIGRLLITFVLCQQNLLEKPVLYISYYLKAHRQEYYDRLQRIRDLGDWEGWLKFFLRGIAEVARQATETARLIVALREEHREIIAARFDASSGNAMKLLSRLYEHPAVTVKDVKDFLNISYPSAYALIEKFVTNEILTEITGQKRNRRYFYASYINLFTNIPEPKDT
jgi:Fic family protein